MCIVSDTLSVFGTKKQKQRNITSLHHCVYLLIHSIGQELGEWNYFDDNAGHPFFYVRQDVSQDFTRVTCTQMTNVRGHPHIMFLPLAIALLRRRKSDICYLYTCAFQEIRYSGEEL